jgi:hypothetical protein
MVGAALTTADMTGAVMRGADMSNTNLTGANLTRAHQGHEFSRRSVLQNCDTEWRGKQFWLRLSTCGRGDKLRYVADRLKQKTVAFGVITQLGATPVSGMQ